MLAERFAGKRDPVPTDHCPQCQKKLTPPKRRPDVRLELYRDPFCSTVCCKAWYGVSWPC